MTSLRSVEAKSRQRQVIDLFSSRLRPGQKSCWINNPVFNTKLTIQFQKPTGVYYVSTADSAFDLFACIFMLLIPVTGLLQY